jgi:CheY-like chemotaxis protein
LDQRQMKLQVVNRDLEAETSALEVSNQQLEFANRQLEEATRHKSEFLANMSHELRTPLNAILGFSQLMIDDLPGRIDAKTNLRFLNQVNSSGQHLLGLINDILDLSKVEAGQMDLHLARIAVADTIEMVVTTVEPLATKKDIKVASEAGRDLYLMADPGKLKQMLLNLVSNAIKFTPAGGQVTIAARLAQSMIEISVVDTGIGMSGADLKSIFQEFRQLAQGPDRQQEGTGLGLALTKRFAELHGGTVSVQSSEGRGSTFTLRLPIEPPSAKTEPTPEATPRGVTDLTRPLILVVEDNPPAAELLVRYLDRGGFRMEIARTGTEALTKARALKPVAITLDILLPEIDGWEVLTRLKQEDSTRDIPVVVVSVVDNPDLGHALGALDYFVKPVDREALLSRLDRYCLTSKVRREEIRILVVDDEPSNLEYLDSVLQPAGCTVLRASGGQEGIDMARTHKPHLVLLDLIMPGVTGFDVVEQLRSDDSTRSIPIMVLTAKQLTDEDKKQLNGYVAAVFERNSLAGPELISWLRQLVGVP